MDTQVDKFSVYSNCVDPVGWDESANMPKPHTFQLMHTTFKLAELI